jgi:hypothetical protein
MAWAVPFCAALLMTSVFLGSTRKSLAIFRDGQLKERAELMESHPTHWRKNALVIGLLAFSGNAGN